MEGGHPTHRPVLAKQTVEILQPKPGQTFIDATVGYGGHARLLLSAIGSKGTLIGIDQDRAALEAATDRLKPFGDAFVPVHDNFTHIDKILHDRQVESVDGILLDLGVSSPQLGDPARGFGFTHDGPLDMRMDTGSDGPTAEQLVNELPERELADLIFQYGEDRLSRRIARTLVRARETGRIETTQQLANLIKRAYPKKRFRIHPATRTFQALRIGVNDELEILRGALDRAMDLLAPGGRMAVISFHSLEDRIVKHRFRAADQAGRFRVLTKKPVTADTEAVQDNPRARSAKLRGIERN